MLAENRLHRVDALRGLSRLDADSVDLIVTDPPYNVARPDRNTIRGGKVVSTMKVWGAWDRFDPFDYDLFILQVISQCHRVLKSGGALYMFTAREDNGHFIRQAKARGFVYRNQLATVKKSPQPSLSKANWRSGFELCMYLTKGKPQTFNFVSQAECVNVFAHGTRPRYSAHPTEKPLEFIRRMVRVSSNPGDLVLDPFVGSGTTAVAAKELGRRFLGFDTHAGYLREARRRLASTPWPKDASRTALAA